MGRTSLGCFSPSFFSSMSKKREWEPWDTDMESAKMDFFYDVDIFHLQANGFLYKSPFIVNVAVVIFSLGKKKKKQKQKGCVKPCVVPPENRDVTKPKDAEVIHGVAQRDVSSFLGLQIPGKCP